MPVRAQVRRFYDGGLPSSPDQPPVPPDPARDPHIVLVRHADTGVERFALARRLAYLDRHLGELLVPADPASFRTDLTSVPWLFTWLVPTTGAHLPAALLHDGLVHPPGSPPTYVATDGQLVDRATADRVFRDAMADTGTGVVRRWVVWSAVTTATMVLGGAGRSRLARSAYRLVAVTTVLVVGYLGTCATADLFDLRVAGLAGLPWMGHQPFPRELVGGAAGAVVIPLLLGLAWGRYRVAGAVVGVLLALLLHVSVVLLALTGLYRGVEWLAGGWPRLAASAGMGVVLVTAAVFAAAVL